MLHTQLNKDQQAIIMDICDQQIQTLVKVSMNPIDHISKDEKDNGISDLLKSFSKLKQEPNTVFRTDDHTYSLVKHTLVNNDKRYAIFKDAVSNLWGKIIVKDNFKLILS